MARSVKKLLRERSVVLRDEKVLFERKRFLRAVSHRLARRLRFRTAWIVREVDLVVDWGPSNYLVGSKVSRPTRAEILRLREELSKVDALWATTIREWIPVRLRRRRIETLLNHGTVFSFSGCCTRTHRRKDGGSRCKPTSWKDWRKTQYLRLGDPLPVASW